MNRFLLSFFALLVVSFATAQVNHNLTQTGHLNYQQLHNTELNDIWGYVDETGVEYALVGTKNGTSVVSLSDPTNPSEVFWEPGMQSIWRDLKTWGDYAFVTTEAQNGLLIIDLSPLPSSTSLTTSYYYGPNTNNWSSAHNLYIDENGYCYIYGANRDNGGVIILDVHTDPMNPIEVGSFENWYVHDGYTRNDTMYLAHINDGFFSMVDVTDKSNPVLLGTKTTPTNFSHNIWLSDDGNYVFTTDELPNSYIGAYDISDPNAIVEVDRIESTPNSGVIPHNTHVLGNYIITSHYTDGVVIHDVTHPYNMVEVASFDTYPLQNTNYDGCWGAYPFLPSQLVLATDQTEGLFVLTPNYVQASYLEGIVTDANTGSNLNQVLVQITGDEHSNLTNPNGFYAGGMATAGVYDVTFSKTGYIPQTVSVTLNSGVITTQNIQLVPIPPFNLQVTVIDATDNTPIENAHIEMIGSLLSPTGTTNALGEEDMVMYYQEDYEVIVGKWGYNTHCETININSSTSTITIALTPGYYDDFTFDFGWSVTGNATTGIWERGKAATYFGDAAPTSDVSNDCGNKLFVTGNMDGVGTNQDDVDGGVTILTSPVLDLSTHNDPYVNYTRWFYSYHGAIPFDDKLKVLANNGTQIVEIDVIGSDTSTNASWIEKSIRLSDFISPTSTTQFIFKTSDYLGSDNITEAALDRFFISEGVVGLTENGLTDFQLFPNPATNQLTIYSEENGNFQLLDALGRIIREGTTEMEKTTIDLFNLKSGVYYLKLGNRTKPFVKK